MFYTILEDSWIPEPSNKLWNHILKSLRLMKLSEIAGVIAVGKSQPKE